ncbi:hypothetical protein IAR55_004444 [Kwoniella newhampshirensis]|uniref:Uncharacterized protein n=1 Tax=Kwoniella newhampshirensis TaxID=1651941 RepID=A0AAW0YPI1_9TREE
MEDVGLDHSLPSPITSGDTFFRSLTTSTCSAGPCPSTSRDFFSISRSRPSSSQTTSLKLNTSSTSGVHSRAVSTIHRPRSSTSTETAKKKVIIHEPIDLTLSETDEDEPAKMSAGNGKEKEQIQMSSKLSDASSTESIVCLGQIPSGMKRTEDSRGKGQNRLVQSQLPMSRTIRLSASRSPSKKPDATHRALTSSVSARGVPNSSIAAVDRSPLSSAQRLPPSPSRPSHSVKPFSSNRKPDPPTASAATVPPKKNAFSASQQRPSTTSGSHAVHPARPHNVVRTHDRPVPPIPATANKLTFSTSVSAPPRASVPDPISRAPTSQAHEKVRDRSTTPRITTADWTRKLKARAEGKRSDTPANGVVGLPKHEISPLKDSVAAATKVRTSCEDGASLNLNTSSRPLLFTSTRPVPPRQDNNARTTSSGAGPSKPRSKSIVSKSTDHDNDDESYRPKIKGVLQQWQPALVPTPLQRPSRPRPQPGAYEIPAADTPINDWPRSQSTHSAERFKRSKGKQKEADMAPVAKSINQAKVESARAPVVEENEAALAVSRMSSAESILTPLSSRAGSSLKDSSPPSLSPQIPQSPLSDKGGAPLSELTNGNSISPLKAKLQETVEGPTDILDEFADWDWAEPVPESHGDTMLQAASPMRDSFSRPNDSGAEIPKTPVPGTPTKPSQHQLTPSRVPPTTPRSTQKRSHPTSPLSSAKRRRILSDKWEEVLKEERALEQAEAEKARSKAEAMRKKLEEVSKEAEREEEEQDDIGALLNVISKTSPQKLLPVRSIGTLQSIRLREKERKAKAEVDWLARREKKVLAARQAEREIEDRKRKHDNRMFDKLVKNAERGAIFEEVMRDLSRGEAEEAFPSPDSGNFDDDDSAGEDQELVEGDRTADWDLDQVADRLIDDGMDVDKGLLRDAKATRMNGIIDEDIVWDGFWNAKPEHPIESTSVPQLNFSSNDPVLCLIKATAEADDIDTLTVLISSGILDAIDLEDSHSEVCEWLLSAILTTTDPQWRSVATIALLQIVTSKSFFTHFTSERTIATLQVLGASHSILFDGPVDQVDAEPFLPEVSVTDREGACVLFCQLICAETKRHPSYASKAEAKVLLPVFLPLFVDSSTSDTLKRYLSEVINCLIGHGISMDGETDGFRDVAVLVDSVSRSYPLPVRAAIINALGVRSPETGGVHRWLALESLLEGSAEEVDQSSPKPMVPPVPLLVKGVQAIYDALQSDEPNWSDINHLVSFLYAAMSDIDKIVEMYPPNMDNVKGVKELIVQHPLEEVRILIRHSRDRISDQSDGSRKSLVKARLHQLLEISRLSLQLSLKKRIRARTVGEGLKLGQGGQTRLDFAKKEVD